MMNTDTVVYVVGTNQEKNFNIYKTTVKEAEEQGHISFESWMKARRYIRSKLEDDRAVLMRGLFEVDKLIRNVDKLKESHCRELDQKVEASFEPSTLRL